MSVVREQVEPLEDVATAFADVNQACFAILRALRRTRIGTQNRYTKGVESGPTGAESGGRLLDALLPLIPGHRSRFRSSHQQSEKRPASAAGGDRLRRQDWRLLF